MVFTNMEDCIVAVLLVMYKVAKSEFPSPVFLLLYSFAYYLSGVTHALKSSACFSYQMLALAVIEINALNFIRPYYSLTD